MERSPRRDYFAAPAFGVASVGFCDSNSLPHAARPAPIRYIHGPLDAFGRLLGACSLRGHFAAHGCVRLGVRLGRSTISGQRPGYPPKADL